MRTGTARRSPSLLVLRAAAMAAAMLAAGCVDRRFIIESNVPNAEVYIDNNPIGAAPAHAPFEYYGYYTITIVHPGYEIFNERVRVSAPWYGYPPIDLITEVLWPFHIHDTRKYYYELHECTRPRIDELLNNAEALRQRGQNLPIPEHPAPPKVAPTIPPPERPSIPPPAPAAPPPVGPGAAGPPPGPQVSPAPLAPPTGPAAPLVPSVAPQ